MGKSLMAVLGIGKGTWGHVARLIAETEWDKILLISNEWGQQNFAPSKEAEWILINNRAGFEILKDTIKEKLPEGEIAVSLISGSGKEHMALIAALKEKASKYEFVVLTGDGTKYF
ncbi:MAG TPA: hypothetical protein HA252_02620 [Candidatus Diapherotrites archaeon]|uniref:Uncharacterized protein n=1 Tax=Candidatus Iainarchaeum sp. TaxID=3101447 RepID=A0A7J4JET8_9ARCH|nr:hypothetical protein [Candidatus Diapherotrites archaeon]HIH16273.1 hypothetical protein [Candidatus Diapherotrites archaeon]